MRGQRRDTGRKDSYGRPVYEWDSESNPNRSNTSNDTVNNPMDDFKTSSPQGDYDENEANSEEGEDNEEESPRSFISRAVGFGRRRNKDYQKTKKKAQKQYDKVAKELDEEETSPTDALIDGLQRELESL